MPNVAVRGLGSIGVINDLPAVDLPLAGLTEARNVVFRDGAITRSPVFRELYAHADVVAHPQGMICQTPPNGFDRTIVVGSDGSYLAVDNGHSYWVSPADYSAGTTPVSTGPVSGVSQAGAIVINRQLEVPVYMTSGDMQLRRLPGWQDTWRCGALRAYKDMLVAVDISRGGARYSNMVKWSGYWRLDQGPVPMTWDKDDPQTQAGENMLAGLASPLVDAVTLRDACILYANQATWAMTATGGSDIFAFRLLFERRGIIGTNAAMDMDGMHYCLGDQDIWMHDGVTARSIVANRIRNRVFRHLDRRLKGRCFVTTDQTRRLVYFCYPSAEPGLKFSTADGGCNVAAVYHVDSQAWSFIDLPNTVAALPMNPTFTETYADAPQSYEQETQTYAEKGDTFDKQQVFLTGHRLLVMDEAGRDAVLPNLITTTTHNGEPRVVREGLSLAEMAGLDAYKIWREVQPLVELEGAEDGIVFRLGAAPWVSSPTAWGPAITYRPGSSRHFNARTGGRLLAYEIRPVDPLRAFRISGFDFDPAPLGHR
jgi:hypothetical protein